MRLVNILVFCGLAAVWNYSQTPSAPQTSKHKTKVETKYDAHKNETELRIGPLALWKPPENSGSGDINFESVDLFVYFSYTGKKIVTPTSVTLLVFSNSQWGPEFEKTRNISISTDAGIHNLGDLEVVSSNRGRVTTRASPPYTQDMLTTEVVRKSIPFDEFVQIAQSKKVEIKLGDRKFKITSEHLEAFRNFVTLMKQQGLEF